MVASKQSMAAALSPGLSWSAFMHAYVQAYGHTGHKNLRAAWVKYRERWGPFTHAVPIYGSTKAKQGLVVRLSDREKTLIRALVLSLNKEAVGYYVHSVGFDDHGSMAHPRSRALLKVRHDGSLWKSRNVIVDEIDNALFSGIGKHGIERGVMRIFAGDEPGNDDSFSDDSGSSSGSEGVLVRS